MRSKALAIEQDVKKLRIVHDPKIHGDLLRFCQHTRLAFLARNVPPDVMMRPADVNPGPGRGNWRSGIVQRSGIVAAPVLIQDAIILAILQRGLGATFRHPDSPRIGKIVELPHHKVGLGITPLQASGLAAFYSATVVDAKAQLMEMVRSRTPIDRFADQRSPLDGTGVRAQERVYQMRVAPLSGPPSFWIP